jgi:hypothetical protein
MSPVYIGASPAGSEHCRDVLLFPISGWGRAENRLKRLLSCVGMSKLLEWFLLFLATMASSRAEDRRLAKDGGEVRICSIRLITNPKGSSLDLAFKQSAQNPRGTSMCSQFHGRNLWPAQGDS